MNKLHVHHFNIHLLVKNLLEGRVQIKSFYINLWIIIRVVEQIKLHGLYLSPYLDVFVFSKKSLPSSLIHPHHLVYIRASIYNILNWHGFVTSFHGGKKLGVKEGVVIQWWACNEYNNSKGLYSWFIYDVLWWNRVLTL